jgi:hypothetical protein
MKDLLSALSSYHILNYMLPGVVFTFLSADTLHYQLAQAGIVAAPFLYYFIGMVISRFGSIIIEPILKGLSFVRFAEYNDFVAAEKKDEKLEVLSETNNMYRSFCSLFSLLLLLKLYAKLAERMPWLGDREATALVVLLLVLFLFSYRKQTAYTTKRLKANDPAA